MTIKCPNCNKDFIKNRKNRVYCSHQCVQSNWNKRNPEVGRKSNKKWAAKNPNKIKSMNDNAAPRKRVWSRLRRYGITKQDFELQLEKQNYSCYGCLRVIDESASVDHDHKTGTVRGLLCRECNLALGLAKENIGTLRRLMAYMDYDRTKTNIYLIGALKNKRIPEIGNLLRSKGFIVMDEWFTPGEFADVNWQSYENLRGRSYKEALRGRAATNIFWFDRCYLDHSDIAILVMPAGRSGMLELGYAKGRGKRVYIFMDGQDIGKYEVMPNFVDDVLLTEEEMINALTK